MPDQINSTTDQVPVQNDDQTQQVQESPVGPGLQKEKEILSEIVRSSEAADEQAEREIQKEISEAKLSRPEPEIPPDLVDSGLKAPQKEADNVVVGGTTIELPIEEEKYNKALHQKVAGAVVDKVVVGTSSIFALAAWVGRILKIAHKHAMKVVFRKPSFAASSAEVTSATKAEKATEGKGE